MSLGLSKFQKRFWEYKSKCIIFISNFHYEIIAFFIFPSVARVRAKFCTKYPKLMLKTSQLWMPCPQDPIFQHLLEPETGIEGAIKIAKKFQRPCMLNKTPRFTLKASKLRMPWPRIPFSNNLVSLKLALIMFFHWAFMLKTIPKNHV